MVEYVKRIIVPYIAQMRQELKLSDDHPALVLFDVFKGQCTDEIFKLLEINNILYVTVPPNTTDRLQPSDLSVNMPAKDYMKYKLQNRYVQIICQQLDNGVHEVV